MKSDPRELVVGSEEMRQVMSQAERAALNNFSVLLMGESGVGKEVIARYIHNQGARSGGPFVAVNCGAIPETLFEAELFGFERGAFTNAFASHKGHFEQADGGTILLDEISELPLSLQVKLLRVLEEKAVTRVGGEKETRVDARIISASNVNLQNLVREGGFRKDLYYRLAVSVVVIPPLRERKDDIESLAACFLQRHSPMKKTLSLEATEKLVGYDWPGNVRELEYCIVRSILSSDGRDIIQPDEIHFLEEEIPSNNSAERRTFEEILRSSSGNVNSVSRKLGVHRNTVYNRIRRLNIDLLRFRNGRPLLQ